MERVMIKKFLWKKKWKKPNLYDCSHQGNFLEKGSTNSDCIFKDLFVNYIVFGSFLILYLLDLGNKFPKLRYKGIPQASLIREGAKVCIFLVKLLILATQ